MTAPAAIPPMSEFQASPFPRKDSAMHSVEAKAPAAALNRRAGRAMVRRIGRNSDFEVSVSVLPAAVVMGSGVHAAWAVPKKVPAAAPVIYRREVQDAKTSKGKIDEDGV